MTQVCSARRIVSSIALSTSLLLLSGLAGLGISGQAQESSPDSTSTSDRVYHTRFQLGPGEGISEVNIEGAVRFSPDDTRIEWIGDGAYLSITTLEQGQTLHFDAKADKQGNPSVSYQVDGQTHPFDEEAASYLAHILPIVFKELGHDEIDRVQTIYDQDGANGVFRMISEIRSNYSIGLHVSAFLALEELSDEEIIESFSILGHHINSDYELASVLYQTTDLYRERPGVRRAYLECLNKFQSEMERSRITKNLFGLETIKSDEQPPLIKPSGC